MRIFLFGAVAGTILAAWPEARAHHSPAAYDLRSGIELEGRVTRIEWANPHVFVFLEVESSSGESDTWQIEADTPANMARHGWYRESLQPGDEVTAQAFPGRESRRRIAKLFAFVKADGTRLSYVDPALMDFQSSDQAADGLAGTWAPDPLAPESRAATLQEQLLRVAFGLDGDVPLTARGIEAVRSFSDEMSPTVECVPRTAPSTTMYSSGLHAIEIREDSVVLRENTFGTERVVHLDVDSHEDAPLSLQGHAIGRWDGDVLVVDSARFEAHREGLFNRLPSSTGKRLIERFSLNPDGTSLTYRWEVSDPEYLTASVSGENIWSFRPDLEFTSVECSLDSARRFLED